MASDELRIPHEAGQGRRAEADGREGDGRRVKRPPFASPEGRGRLASSDARRVRGYGPSIRAKAPHPGFILRCNPTSPRRGEGKIKRPRRALMAGGPPHGGERPKHPREGGRPPPPQKKRGWRAQPRG